MHPCPPSLRHCHRHVNLPPLAVRPRACPVQNCGINSQSLHGHAPQHLGPLIRVANLPDRRSIRSVGTNRLEVPPVKLSTVGSRTFPVVCPQIWNDLLEHVTSAESLSTFCENGLFKK